MNKFKDHHLPVPITEGVVLRRDNNAEIWTNVPHLIVNASPTGFDWGYGGSAPADLALNILEAVLKEMHHQGQRVVDLYSGDSCYQLADELHQQFKWDFLFDADRYDTTIPYAEIEKWIKDRMADK